MPRTLHACWGPTLLLALLLASGEATAARSDWREMTVGHFHLYSTLRDSSTREVARQLQVFEQTLEQILLSDDRLPDVPTLIYILNAHDYAKYAAPRAGTGGFFLDQPTANILVIDGDSGFDLTRAVVFHEYTHFFLRNSRSMQFPPWYSEGYAELFSSFRIDKGQALLGEFPSHVTLSLDSVDWIPMQRVLAVKQTDPEYRGERLAPQFYGEAWALVHLLLFDDHSLTAPTSRYLVNVNLGFGEPEAFAQAFPFTKAGLDDAVRKLINCKIIHLKRVTFVNPVAVDEGPLTRLTAPQADTVLTRLTLMLGKPHEMVASLMDAAVKENPTDMGVRALAARVAAHTDRPFDASELATRLAPGGTGDEQARIDVADALLAREDPGAVAAQVLAILDGIVHADSPSIEAVGLWAAAAGLSQLDSDRALAVLEPAARRVPHDTRFLWVLARIRENRGEKAKARELYTRIIVVSAVPEERSRAQKQADSAWMQDEPPQPPAAEPAPSRPPKRETKPPPKS